jgi:archaellum biogenesis protein FlaJ (TadC family)
MPSAELLYWLGGLSVAIFFISLVSLPWLVARIPADYFCHNRRQPTPWKDQHPIIRAILLALKNLLGWVLLIGGFVMIFIPGQGLLTMAMGLLLMDYPGKYALERRIVALPAVHKGLNWLREKRGVEALRVD